MSDSPRPSPRADRLASELRHLGHAIPHGRVSLADNVHTARLLLGLNLAIAHLAQLTPRLADQIDTGTGPRLTGIPDPARGELAKALTTAGCRLDGAASLFKEAHALFPRPAEPRS